MIYLICILLLGCCHHCNHSSRKLFMHLLACYRIITRAYVNRRGPRRKGVNMDVILSSLSLMAASLLALVRGIAIAIIIMQAVIAVVLW